MKPNINRDVFNATGYMVEKAKLLVRITMCRIEFESDITIHSKTKVRTEFYKRIPMNFHSLKEAS